MDRSVPPAALACALALALGTVPADARRRPAPSPTPSPTATPVPLPTATPLSAAARAARLRQELVALAHEAPGRLGICVLDLATEERFSVRGDEAFPLASAVKLPLAIVAYRLADQRKLDLDERVTLTRGDYRRGPSAIVAAHPRGGGTYANWELLRETIARSDNTASDVVLREIGGPTAVDRILHRLNVSGFVVRESEANLAADADAHRSFARGGDNVATPNAMADLLAGLATQRFTLLDATNELLLDLERTETGVDRLRAGFPPSFRLAHKTGTGDTFDGAVDATNDAALVTLPDGRRLAVVAFLAGSRADAATRDATLARVARAVADAYAP